MYIPRMPFEDWAFLEVIPWMPFEDWAFAKFILPKALGPSWIQTITGVVRMAKCHFSNFLSLVTFIQQLRIHDPKISPWTLQNPWNVCWRSNGNERAAVFSAEEDQKRHTRKKGKTEGKTREKFWFGGTQKKPSFLFTYIPYW